MADHPQKSGAHARPLSPHLTIYRWPVTMMTSITHRVTGVGLSVGAVILAWWLVSVSNGPEGWERFHAVSETPIGLLILFGLIWSLVYHFLNGIRHLAWDAGWGFDLKVAYASGYAVLVGTGVLTVLAWILAYATMGKS